MRIRKWRDVRKFAALTLVLSRKAIEKFRGSRPALAAASEIRSGKSLDLSRAVIVITGSSRGIGHALAEAFLDEGASVILNGRDSRRLAQARARLARKERKLDAIAADISTPVGASKLIRSALDKFGKIDVLINNAGVLGPVEKRIWELAPEEWQSVLDTNVSGPLLCSCEVLRWAREVNHAVRILNVSSGVVTHGCSHLGAYAVSKAALEALTTAVHVDRDSKSPVSIVTIRPSSVQTRLTKQFFSSTEYDLMEAPESEVAPFLYAATAPMGEIEGKTLSSSSFVNDPKAEIVLNNTLAGFVPWQLTLETPADSAEADAAYMHLLQNPRGAYPSVRAAVKQAMERNRSVGYPDPSYRVLRNALAERLGLATENIAVGTGSSELLDRAIRTFAVPNGEVILTKPSWWFVSYFLQRYGLRWKEVPHKGSMKDKNLSPDLQSILAAINDDTRLVYLVNPCNPTGAVLPPQELEAFLRAVPSHVTVILDEAYFDYCEPEKRFHLPMLLNELNCRALGLRTFSKFFALSGFRVGYAYSSPDIIDYLSRLEVFMTISTLSETAAVAALEDHASQQDTYQTNFEERRRMSKAFDMMGIDHMPSQTNFITFDCPIDKAAMRRAMKERGIYMPNIDLVFLRNYAMTTIGLRHHNQEILDFLSRY